MKKLITITIIVGILIIGYFICYGANKNIAYENNSKEIKGIIKEIIQLEDKDRIDIVCEHNTRISGVNKTAILVTPVDEKTIPADVAQKIYKVNIATKEIYEEVILEEQP